MIELLETESKVSTWPGPASYLCTFIRFNVLKICGCQYIWLFLGINHEINQNCENPIWITEF